MGYRGYREKTRRGHRQLRQLEGWIIADLAVFGILLYAGADKAAGIAGIVAGALFLIRMPLESRFHSNFDNQGTSGVAPGRDQRESDAMARRKNKRPRS